MHYSKDNIEFCGESPDLIGLKLDSLIFIEYWCDDKLCDEVNVVYLLFNGVWYRHYFDCGIIFWRVSEDPPQPFDAPELNAEYRLFDAGVSINLNGKKLNNLKYQNMLGGSQSVFSFSDSVTLTFRNIKDVTSYEVSKK